MKIQKIVDVPTGKDDIKLTMVNIHFDDLTTQSTMFGVDPGTTHIGLASILYETAILYEISKPREDSVVDRIETMWHLMTKCFGAYDMSSIGVVEGASYGDRYRQVELAEIRTAAVTWFMEYSMNPIIVPPKTIRKKIFGNGNIKPEEVWHELPPNAANALACAMYPLHSQQPCIDKECDH